ncbi:MAG TPA: proteasome accessory factor PafA2 family protein, partial [Gemmatimonadales bacterium]|nr:proteasome accessory factor PafA2 family protein [Gemmatimonadales bacterium]
MPIRTLLGMETEYAVTGLDCNGNPIGRLALVHAMLSKAREAYPHLRDGSGNGLFLANGGRLYIDSGLHPEFATPECQDPREVLHYVREGERLLLDLAERVRGDGHYLREVQVFRCNVDYARSGSSWGCHESYLHSTYPPLLPPQLIPHLVSRMIYAGAGGFNPLSPGLEFTLSPRAWLISQTSSGDSTRNRGIYHLKNESLSRTGHRLHVICGESLCSETAALLKLGSTALVLAAIDAGLRPGDAVQLAAPVAALHTVAAGLDRKQGLALVGGGRLSAAEIQRHYLATVESCRAQGRLPGWADAICGLWQCQLDALESEVPSLETTLDWAMKRALYQRWSGDRFSWDRLARCSAALSRLERALGELMERELHVSLEGLLSANDFQRELAQLTPLLASEGLQWADLREFVRLRRELFEAEFRFGQLGTGIFEQLDRSGVLTHRVGGPAPRLPALGQAPAGRARVRGEWIRRLSARGDTRRYRCDWSQLCDELTGRRLD